MDTHSKDKKRIPSARPGEKFLISPLHVFPSIIFFWPKLFGSSIAITKLKLSSKKISLLKKKYENVRFSYV